MLGVYLTHRRKFGTKGMLGLGLGSKSCHQYSEVLFFKPLENLGILDLGPSTYSSIFAMLFKYKNRGRPKPVLCRFNLENYTTGEVPSAVEEIKPGQIARQVRGRSRRLGLDKSVEQGDIKGLLEEMDMDMKAIKLVFPDGDEMGKKVLDSFKMIRGIYFEEVERFFFRDEEGQFQERYGWRLSAYSKELLLYGRGKENMASTNRGVPTL
jgi:hypothetical protein